MRYIILSSLVIIIALSTIDNASNEMLKTLFVDLPVAFINK